MSRRHHAERYLRCLALFAVLLFLFSATASSQPTHAATHDPGAGDRSSPTLVGGILVTNSHDDCSFDDEYPSLTEASTLPSDSGKETPVWECQSFYQGDLRVPCHNRGPPPGPR